MILMTKIIYQVRLFNLYFIVYVNIIILLIINFSKIVFVTVYVPPYHAPKRMILSESDSNNNENDDAFDNDMMSLGNTSRVVYSNNNDTNENIGIDKSELTFCPPPTMINT